MGAAGRDFHNFNTLLRNNEEYEVVAFTATQIPGIANRAYPPELSGSLYPNGIPIRPEEELGKLIDEHQVEEVVFSYSDVSYDYVLERGAIVERHGAEFILPDAEDTMLESSKPIVSVGAVRTGSGKSPTTRRIARILIDKGKKVVVVRHPMPYGDLKKQIVQRFEMVEDLDKHDCTIEEREEYGPLIRKGIVVYAGVDYELILREAEKEADIVIWDGGNNDYPFFKSNLHIVIADALRPGHELTYYPSKVNVRLANVVIINKVDEADPDDIRTVEENVRSLNSKAKIMKAKLNVVVQDGDEIEGKRVLAIEDGPTLTHGDMKFGAAVVAARKYKASELIDPTPYAVGSIKKTLERYGLDNLLPAMGYGDEQIEELEETINASDCDIVLSATPADLSRLLKADKPVLKIGYELVELEEPGLEGLLRDL
ncbi:MAG: GTPase [Methanobacteriota archaeon]|nr:MAG: GTPase [Euryarchaeota archaeon]